MMGSLSLMLGNQSGRPVAQSVAQGAEFPRLTCVAFGCRAINLIKPRSTWPSAAAAME
jgi:hypothetical protein